MKAFIVKSDRESERLPRNRRFQSKIQKNEFEISQKNVFPKNIEFAFMCEIFISQSRRFMGYKLKTVFHSERFPADCFGTVDSRELFK